MSHSLGLPQGFDFSPDRWPDRSVLRGHRPIAAGTGMVASLPAHLIDLAWEHGVPPIDLCGWMADVGAMPGVPGRTREDLMRFFMSQLKQPRATLLGPSASARVVVDCIRRLTLDDAVEHSSLLAWRTVLPATRAFRPFLAYCPCCIEEWSRTPSAADLTPVGLRPPRLYEPLIWQVAALTACPWHGVRLRSACPNPDCRTERRLLTGWARSGSCARCEWDLGVDRATVLAEEGPMPAEDLSWAAGVFNQVAALLSDRPGPDELPSRSRVAQAVTLAAEVAMAGNYARLAELVGHSPGTISLWKDGRRSPSLTGAIRLCVTTGFSLPDFLMGRLDRLAAAIPPTLLVKAPPTLETHVIHDWLAVRRALSVALAETPPPTLRAVVKRLRVDDRQLKQKYPRLCAAIVDRHADWIRERSIDNQTARQRLLISAIRSLHAQGIYPAKHAVERELPTTVRLIDPRLRRLWIDEVVRLGWPNPTRPKPRCRAHGSRQAPEAHRSPTASPHPSRDDTALGTQAPDRPESRSRHPSVTPQPPR